MAAIRIDKILSQLQIASRSESKKMVKQGRITVNGQTVKSSDQKIDPATDRLSLDGILIAYDTKQYLMLHKPAGCITATEDRSSVTVMDYLDDTHYAPGKPETPKNLTALESFSEGKDITLRRDLVPVGRLDKDTEGLLLITNDGALSHALLSPKKHVPKTYYAIVEGMVTESTIATFLEGLDIWEEDPTKPGHLVNLTNDQIQDKLHANDFDISASTGPLSYIELTITEGKFHQVKRMFEAVGMKVLYLKRLSMGSLLLDENLAPGQWRFLREDEIKNLQK